MRLAGAVGAAGTGNGCCRVLVGGFGSPGQRDLDFGAKFIRCAEQLEWPEGVVVEDLSYSAPLVLHRLLELRPAKVVLVRAVSCGLDPPGTIRRYDVAFSPRQADEVHSALADSLAGAVDLDATLAVVTHWGCLPSETLVIEVEAADTSFGPGFSEELAGAIDPILTIVREEVGDERCPIEEPATFDLDAAAVPAAGEAGWGLGAPRDDAVLPDLGQLVAYAQVHEQVGQVVALQHRLPRVGGLCLAGRLLPWGAGLQVGGDWYDAITVDDDVIALVMGDVTGRGVHAASVMAQMQTAIRALALLEGDRPARIIEHLDRLAESSGVGTGTTLLYLTADGSSGRVVVSNAGQCPPLLVAGGGAEFVTAGLSAPLGAPGRAPKPETVVQLPPGSTLLLFTDGLVESRSKPLDQGLEQLRRAAANGPVELDALCDHVLDVCLRGESQDDDVSVLAMRFEPRSATGP